MDAPWIRRRKKEKRDLGTAYRAASLTYLRLLQLFERRLWLLSTCKYVSRVMSVTPWTDSRVATFMDNNVTNKRQITDGYD